MAVDLVFGALEASLQSPTQQWEDVLGTIRGVASFAVSDGYGRKSQELVLRLLEKREELGAAGGVVDALARQFGLYPYMQLSDALSLRDALAYEAHRTDLEVDGESIVFHREQASVYHSLLRGDNVILSAPTSFGKSLIIDALLASGSYENVVVVMPTLALIDETRRRLGKFKSHKVITHGSQSLSRRNIFVMTQERVLNRLPEVPIDLFVIDEFYKLSPSHEAQDDDGRSLLLNQAFYELRKCSAQFYMLGPNVRAIQFGVEEKIDARLVVSDYSTVVSEVIHVPPGNDDEARLLDLVPTIEGQTIVYCSSPARANRVASILAEKFCEHHPATAQAADWAADNYHPEWSFARCLRQGVGIHHGQVPRSLGQFVVRRFNEGRLRFLVCTSTLIEGVNTSAKNVVMYDNKINKKAIDFFTFSNIKGRSGRMFRHFIGRVFLFHDPPDEDLPQVDLPIVSQPDTAPPTLLIQVDSGDLTDDSTARLKPYLEQSLLSIEVLRNNSGVDLDEQLKVAKELTSHPQQYLKMLRWSQEPSYDQLTDLIAFFRKFPLGGRKPSLSDEAATAVLHKFRRGVSLREVIEGQVPYSQGDPELAVTRILGFLRNYLSFSFPKSLRSLHNIAEYVFGRLGEDVSSLVVFATRAENVFLPGVLHSLDEFGIPFPLAKRLERWLGEGDLDEVLENLRHLDADTSAVSDFEKLMIKECQSGL